MIKTYRGRLSYRRPNTNMFRLSEGETCTLRRIAAMPMASLRNNGKNTRLDAFACSCSGCCGSNYAITGGCECSSHCGSNYSKGAAGDVPRMTLARNY